VTGPPRRRSPERPDPPRRSGVPAGRRTPAKGSGERRSGGKATAEPPKKNAAKTAGKSAGKTAGTSAPGRDAAGRRRRRWIVVGALAGAVLVGWVVLGSPLLEVTRIEVVGAIGGREPAVRRASGVHAGDALALVWPGRVSGRVEGLPWVSRARVRRSWPHTVRITVEPRVPVGRVTVPGPSGAPPHYLVVDRTGQVLWSADQQPGAIPELQGAADLARPGGHIAPRVLALAAGALTPDLATRAASVAIDDGSLVVQVADGPQVRFGRPVGVATKSRVAAAVLATLGDALPTYLDVSVPSSPVSG